MSYSFLKTKTPLEEHESTFWRNLLQLLLFQEFSVNFQLITNSLLFIRLLLDYYFFIQIYIRILFVCLNISTIVLSVWHFLYCSVFYTLTKTLQLMKNRFIAYLRQRLGVFSMILKELFLWKIFRKILSSGISDAISSNNSKNNLNNMFQLQMKTVVGTVFKRW